MSYPPLVSFPSCEKLTEKKCTSIHHTCKFEKEDTNKKASPRCHKPESEKLQGSNSESNNVSDVRSKSIDSVGSEANLLDAIEKCGDIQKHQVTFFVFLLTLDDFLAYRPRCFCHFVSNPN